LRQGSPNHDIEPSNKKAPEVRILLLDSQKHKYLLFDPFNRFLVTTLRL